MTLEEIRAEVERACRACGVPEMAAKIVVSWNGRFTARMGDARWDRRRGQGLIRLSVPLWPKASREEQRETVIHEVCHVIADAVYHGNMGHGPKWQRMMKLCGYPEARRCHAVDREAIRARRQQQQVLAACGCPDGVQLGPVQARRLRAGVAYHCRRCRQVVRLPSAS